VLPFDPEAMRRAGYLEILRIVREQESPRPTTRLQGLGKAASDIAHRRGTEARALARQLSGDLEWITLKALEKDRARRYSSATALADDIAPYVKDEPVLAGRPGAVYRLRKYLRRHRAAATIAVSIAAAALATVIAVWAVRRPAPPTPLRAVMPLTRDSGLPTDGVVSRDGKILVYASDRAGGENLDIWIKQLPSGEPVRLTTHPADDNQPDISPDGKLVAFHSDRDGSGIYLTRVSGGEARLIAARGLNPRFSPDSRYLAYWVGTLKSPLLNGQIYIFDMAREEARRFHAEFQAASWPVWSPDGQRILFAGERNESDGGKDWWTAPASGGAATSTGGQALFVSSSRYSASQRMVWSGRGVFFTAPPLLGTDVRDTGNIWRVSISASTWRVTGKPEQITFGTELEVPSSLRADGSLVFSVRRATIDLWQLPLSEAALATVGDPKRLTNDEFEELQPSISMDGRKLVFASDTLGSSADVWLKDLESGEETPLVSTTAEEYAPIISARGDAIAYCTYDGKSADIYYQKLGTPSKRICEGCYPLALFANGTRLLRWDYWDTRSRLNFKAFTAFDTVNNTKAVVLESKDDIFHPDVSPDQRWIAFLSGVSGRLFVAPLQDPPPPREKWVQVSDGSSDDDKPRWSPDGSHLLFTSDRDGFMCLWEQELDRSTKRTVGAPSAIHHFHNSRRSLKNLNLMYFEVALARNRIVFNMAEHAGNIWTTVPDVPTP
jgi:Tol biopolymer transport system component